VPWKSFYAVNHVGAVVRACNYHTCALRHMREHLTTETAQTPAALSCHGSTTATHCCMALLLQSSRSCRARVICQQRRCIHARQLLQSLHWLPVQQRIQYKIAVITHKALSTSVPPYIDELLQCQATTPSLRSTNALHFSVS